jgi:hypothetical protein
VPAMCPARPRPSASVPCLTSVTQGVAWRCYGESHTLEGAMTKRRVGRPCVAAVAVGFALTSSGCSWAFMNRKPDLVAAPNYPLDCTTSRAAPVLDTICAGYFVANTVVLAGFKTCESASPGESCYASGTKNGGMILSAGLAALCALSASSGFRNANQCSQAKDLNAMCITGDFSACQALRPGWTPPGGATPAFHPSMQRAAPVPAAGTAPDDATWDRP